MAGVKVGRGTAWDAAIGAAALGLAGLAAHLELRRRLSADPQGEVLRTPACGQDGTARSADGTGLHVETFGPESGRTVVLVHGWTETIAYWTYEIRTLAAAGLRVVAYDLRGHGRSERAAEGDYSVSRFGEDLEAVLAQFVPEGERAVVAGHSLGAMTIAAWAEHHEVDKRADAAVLVNVGVGELVAESLVFPVPRIARIVNQMVGARGSIGLRTPLPRFATPVSHAAIRYVAFGPVATPAQVAFFERMLVSMPPRVRADVGIAISEIDLYPALERLTVPTIVIAGDKDRLTPSGHARRIAEALPQLHRLMVLKGVGHMAPLERPQAVSDAVMELVDATQEAASQSAETPRRAPAADIIA